MTGIVPDEFLDELKFCIQQADTVKAKALLQFASDSDIDLTLQKKAIAELGNAPEEVAFPLLEYLTKVNISNPEIRQGLYELILDKAYGNADRVIKYITDNTKKTRLLFLKAAEDLVLETAAPSLRQIVAAESDPDVLMAAVRALGALRRQQDIGVFSSLAGHPESSVRHEAIHAISGTGGSDAVDQLLAFMSGREETVKMAVEAIAEIQDLYALQQLTALLSSPITVIRDTAIDELIKLGSKVVPTITESFRNARSDYMVHLITTLGYIGDPAAVNPIMDIINACPKDPNIRQAAFEAMEKLPSRKSAICLAKGLTDPVESVRMGAARALDRNLSSALIAGLKNIVREESGDSQNAVAALIDSGATNLFSFIVDEEAFLKQAQAHIVEKADPETGKRFLSLLKEKGKINTAGKIAEKIFPDGKNRGIRPHAGKNLKIVVVDDSKMMLKLYRNKLAALGCTPHLFYHPGKAIPEIAKQKPDLVITDLNMPDISGLELTREIRKKYTKQQVPILMITTQSDFIQDKAGDIVVNDTMLEKSGINKILHKPFTDEAFKNAVAAFLKEPDRV